MHAQFSSDDQNAVRALYEQLIAAWNERRADGFAACFAENGTSIGFDGSLMDGQLDIEQQLSQIFADHMTARYVARVKAVHFLAPDVVLLRAHAGMIPPGQADLNPAANAIQAVVAAQQGGQWRIVHFQNTPAQFHGRPEAVQAFTADLRDSL